MRRTVGDEQVRPVFHPEEGVTQFDIEIEIVVRPFQTLAVTDGGSELADKLVLVSLCLRQLLVVVAVAGIVVIAGIGVIEVLISSLVAAGPSGLVVEEEAGTQLVRPLASQPRLQEGERDGGGVDTVGTEVDGERLSFALWHNTVGLFVEEVLDSEVGELHTYRTCQTRSTPTERELELVTGLGFQLVGDIHGTVLGVRLDIRHEFLLVEMAHLRQLTERTHDIRLGVELAGFCVEFAAYNVLVNTGVSDNIDFVDSSGLALVHTHFEINGVVLYVDLHRFYVEEEITAVGIEFADGVVVGLEALVEGFEVIDISGFDT